MNSEEILSLIKGGESQTLELKAAVPRPDMIARYLSAFSNTEGGLIIFGVNEPFEIIGIDRAKLERVFELSKKSISSKIQCALDFVDIQGKTLGIVEIKKSETPIFTNEGVFVRTGEQVRPQTADEILLTVSGSSDKDQSIADLSKVLSDQTKIIQDLREDFEKVNSWKRKAFFALSGAAGTAIGKGVWAVIKPWLTN